MSIVEDLKKTTFVDVTGEIRHGFKAEHSTTATALSIQGKMSKAFLPPSQAWLARGGGSARH